MEIPKEEPKYPIGGYAPGYYGCTCVTCKTEFMGDKRAVQCEPCAIKMTKEEPKQEWTPTQGEQVWIKVFSNWSSGTYIGYDTTKHIHLVRENEEGGGNLLSSSKILPYKSMPNEPKQETLEEVAETELRKQNWDTTITLPFNGGFIEGFQQGANWQAERMYNEKEMIDFAFNTYCYISKIMNVPFNQISENKLHAIDNLEQFKKRNGK